MREAHLPALRCGSGVLSCMLTVLFLPSASAFAGTALLPLRAHRDWIPASKLTNRQTLAANRGLQRSVLGELRGSEGGNEGEETKKYELGLSRQRGKSRSTTLQRFMDDATAAAEAASSKVGKASETAQIQAEEKESVPTAATTVTEDSSAKDNADAPDDSKQEQAANAAEEKRVSAKAEDERAETARAAAEQLAKEKAAAEKAANAELQAAEDQARVQAEQKQKEDAAAAAAAAAKEAMPAATKDVGREKETWRTAGEQVTERVEKGSVLRGGLAVVVAVTCVVGTVGAVASGRDMNDILSNLFATAIALVLVQLTPKNK